MTIIYFIIIALAILFEGFFSGAEIAIVSLNRIRLRILSDARDKRARLIQRMLKNPNRLLSTTLVGTNLAVVIASSFCTKLVYDTYGTQSGWLTTLILSPIILVFGELIPKAVFSQRADRITFPLASLLKFFWRIFYPIVWLINIFVNAILSLFGAGKEKKTRSPFVTQEEIKYLIKESESEGEIDTYERSIIYKIFDFGKKKSKDTMKKLDKLIFLKESDKIENLLKKAKESDYSRFPVRSKSGKFVGIVNILDVVYEDDTHKPIKDYLRPIEYVKDTMATDNALFLLQSKKQNLAIVSDSKEQPIGFFTMEDLLEELVGEID